MSICIACASRNIDCDPSCILPLYFVEESDLVNHDRLVEHFGEQEFRKKIMAVHVNGGAVAVRYWISGIVSVYEKLMFEREMLENLQSKVKKLEKDLLLAKGCYYWKVQELEKELVVIDGGDDAYVDGSDKQADADGADVVGEERSFLLSWGVRRARGVRKRRLVFGRLFYPEVAAAAVQFDIEFDSDSVSEEHGSESSDYAPEDTSDYVSEDTLDYDPEVTSDYDPEVISDSSGSSSADSVVEVVAVGGSSTDSVDKVVAVGGTSVDSVVEVATVLRRSERLRRV